MDYPLSVVVVFPWGDTVSIGLGDGGGTGGCWAASGFLRALVAVFADGAKEPLDLRIYCATIFIMKLWTL